MKTDKRSRRAWVGKGVMTGVAVAGMFAVTVSSAEAQSDRAAQRAAADSLVCHRSKSALMQGYIQVPGATFYPYQPPRVTATDSAFARRAEAELDSLVQAGDSVSLPRVRIVTCKIPLYTYIVSRDNKVLNEGEERSDPWGEKKPAAGEAGDKKPVEGRSRTKPSK